MKKRKIIPAILAGVALLSINSSVMAADRFDSVEVKKIINEETNQVNIEYRPKSLSSSGTRFLSNVFSRIADNNVGVSLPTSYMPAFKSNLTIKNQAVTGTDTSECWANVFASACEAYNYARNLANSGEEYSARHINQSCGNKFADQTITENAFNRDAVTSPRGNFYFDFAYAANRQGPGLESDMPSSGSLSYINYGDLKTANGTRLDVNEYTYFPSVYKKYYEDGTVEYYNSYDYSTKQYDNKIDDVNLIRNTIKQQIKENGGVMATIFQCDGDKDVFAPALQTSDGTSLSATHAVFIVGWDDDYMPENDDILIPDNTWPWEHKGAYIALNSYGEDAFYDGYTYISYDDFYVEQFVAGIKTAGVAEDDNAYVHDELGVNANYPFATNSVSVVNIFDRNSSGNEILNGIGIPSNLSQKANVYYTENFDTNGLPVNFKVLKENMDLDIGCTYLETNNLKLTKSKFAICVTYIGTGNSVEVPVEAKYTSGTGTYSYVTAKDGEGYVVYTNDEDLSFDYTSNTYIYHDLKDGTELVNFGIRAYTSNEGSNPDPTPDPSPSGDPSPSPSENPTPSDKVTSDMYTVKNNLITRVPLYTTVEEFKDDITVDGDYQILDRDDNVVTSTLIRTGYKVKVGDDVFTISVVSDISGSGGDTYSRTLDLSKMRAHIVQYKNSILTGAQLDAADINGDGNVSIIDLSKLRGLAVE